MNECGKCDLCCSLLPIDDWEFEKPAHTKCPNLAECGGCSIYENRPTVCADYQCGWKLFGLPTRWKPSVCDMIVNLGVFPIESLGIWLGESAAERWRREPWLGDIQKLALYYLASYGQLTMVYPYGFRKGVSSFLTVDPTGGESLACRPGDAALWISGQLFAIDSEQGKDIRRGQVLEDLLASGWVIRDRRLENDKNYS